MVGVAPSVHARVHVMRVLVVEDDRALGEVVRRGLAEDGHAVDLVTTVAAADEAVHVENYDLVVLDLGLPDGDQVDGSPPATSILENHSSNILYSNV